MERPRSLRSELRRVPASTVAYRATSETQRPSSWSYCPMLRYLTAGESHGPMLTAILDGIPANLSLAVEEITLELARRQQGYGRGGRMRSGKDEANIVGGVRHGLTMGGPIAILIANRDWENWKLTMDPTPTG